MFEKDSCSENVYGKEGGRTDYRNFPLKNFCLKGPKNFVGKPLVCHYFRVSNKFILQRVMPRVPVEVFLSHSTEHFVEKTYCAVFQKISGGGKVFG